MGSSPLGQRDRHAMDHNTDPRLEGEFIRRIATASGAVTLVGVVHDHPASVHRVRARINDIDPDVLALELPPSAVALFEQYARGSQSPPTFGGEMSAAIQAAATDQTAGIDRPTPGFIAKLARNIVDERPSMTTVRRVLRNTASTVKHALLCRGAATVARQTGVRLEVDAPTVHDVDRTDSPGEQARDEQKQVRQSRAFMNAFGDASSSQASQLADATREQHMADRLSALAERGSVVAVVGIDHLDSLTELLVAADQRHSAT